jgi:cleavage stimulation factor subunit 2
MHFFFYCPRNPTQYCHMQVAAAPDIPLQETRLPDRASHQAELTHPSKLRKLEDGTSTLGNVNNSHAIYSAPSQVMVPGGPSGSYSSGAVNFQPPENEVAQVIHFIFQI